MTRRQFLFLIIPLLAVLLGFLGLTIAERTGAGTPGFWDQDFVHYVRDQYGAEFAMGLGSKRKQEEAFFNAVNAWVQTFDIRGGVYPPWEVEAQREEQRGRYAGIGVRILPKIDNNELVALEITGVKPDGPADHAGIRRGDKIVSVAGTPIAKLCPVKANQTVLEALDPAQKAIRGKAGTRVVLSIEDPKGERRDVTVTRAIVVNPSVFGGVFVDEKAKIGYIHISEFKENTGSEMRAELKQLLDGGAKGLILDLRSNGGGMLPQGIDVVDAFVSSGPIVRIRGRLPELSETFNASAKNTMAPDLPLAVLIDRGSASASEVVSGALQDKGRAILVGEKSFGKFTVQNLIPVQTKAGPVTFKLTTAIYETPLGRSFPRSRPDQDVDLLGGLRPDVAVPSTTKVRQHVEKVFEEESAAAWTPGMKVARPLAEDPVLGAAVKLLRGEPVYPAVPTGP